MMNVKKASVTTIWLIGLFVGIAILLPLIKQALPKELMHPTYYIGGFYPIVVNLASWAMLLAAAIDVVLNSKYHVGLLGSFVVILILSVPTIIVAIIPGVTPYIFYGICQFLSIIGTYWSFRKITYNLRSGGQKMIPFIKEIKNRGDSPIGHIIDHNVVYAGSLALLAIGALLVLSFLIYMIAYWNLLV